MVDTQHNAQLKQLVYEYYNRSISFADYRDQRTKILDRMDKQYNGADIAPHPDDTQPRNDRG